MAGTAPGPGQPQLGAGQQNALAAAIGSVSPPANNKTPFQRTDPEKLWLERLNVPRQGFDDLEELLDDKDDITVGLVTALRTATIQLLQMQPAKDIAYRTASAILKAVSPQLSMQVDQEWVASNRPPTVPGTPIQTGPTPSGAPGGMPSPGINPGVLAAMAGQGQGMGPGSPPPPG